MNPVYHITVIKSLSAAGSIRTLWTPPCDVYMLEFHALKLVGITVANCISWPKAMCFYLLGDFTLINTSLMPII